MFDYIVGTNTGSFIAMALTSQDPPATISQISTAFDKLATEAFGLKADITRNIHNVLLKTPNKPLRKFLQDYFGDTLLFRRADRNPLPLTAAVSSTTIGDPSVTLYYNISLFLANFIVVRCHCIV